ncbi:unnamed protein product, partial [Gulo gulo]
LCWLGFHLQGEEKAHTLRRSIDETNPVPRGWGTRPWVCWHSLGNNHQLVRLPMRGWSYCGQAQVRGADSLAIGLPISLELCYLSSFSDSAPSQAGCAGSSQGLGPPGPVPRQHKPRTYSHTLQRGWTRALGLLTRCLSGAAQSQVLSEACPCSL